MDFVIAGSGATCQQPGGLKIGSIARLLNMVGTWAIRLAMPTTGSPAAGSVLASVELMHMIQKVIHKGQFALDGMDTMSFADQFSVLAGKVLPECAAQCRSRKTPPFDRQRDIYGRPQF